MTRFRPIVIVVDQPIMRVTVAGPEWSPVLAAPGVFDDLTLDADALVLDDCMIQLDRSPPIAAQAVFDDLALDADALVFDDRLIQLDRSA